MIYWYGPVTDPRDRKHCYEVRNEVFVKGQSISAPAESDGNDYLCHHFLGMLDEQVIAAARIFPEGLTAKVQRVAVLPQWQKTGAGRRLMTAVITFAAAEGYQQLLLGAQFDVIGFYAKLGFKLIGEEYQEVGIRHQNMRLTL